METNEIKKIVAEETAKIDNAAIPAIVVGKDLSVDKPWERREFNTYLNSVKAFAYGQKQLVDPRLYQNAATTYGAEAVGADGGFATPTVFATKITEIWKGSEEYKIVEACDTFFTTSNNCFIPVDVSAPWLTSGIYAQWGSEGIAAGQRKPALKQEIVMLNRLQVLVPVSRELEQDGLDISGHIARKSAMAIGYTLANAILEGVGTNCPQGILNAGTAAIAVTRTTALKTDFADICSMWDHMPAYMRQSAIWVASPRVQSLLKQMTIGSYMSPIITVGGFAAQGQTDQLFGRPIIYTEANTKAIGYVGDLILVDLQNYNLLMKTTGIDYELSTQFFFDTYENCHRMVMRVGGRNALQAPITASDGSSTLSNVVTLTEHIS
jgi:HK97 family phage major capsid protein